MTRIDIFSGFLGAGKTTLIRKLIAEGYQGEKLVLIENEFGEIAVDGAFLQDAGVQITEMNSGCICCTLVGDFTKALAQVMADFAPDRILIEPSGVGKLSDVAAAVERVEGAEIGAKVTVVDAGKCKMYARNFGEFFNDQVASADLIVLSRTDSAADAKTLAAVELLQGINPSSRLITTPWDQISGAQIREVMEENVLQRELQEMEHEHHHHHHHDEDEEHECCHHHHHDEDEEHECCHHHHHDDDDEEHECCHHHHHDDDDEEHECCHHHHDDDDEEHECCHHHHHDEDEEHEHHHHHHHHEDGEECDDPDCECHHHDHGDGHHHHHHADEIFTSWGMETPRKFTEEELRAALDALQDEAKYGVVLRAKGLVDSGEGDWIYFDYVPGEIDVRRGGAAVIGRFCVIGSKLNEQALKELFRV
ncbi:MAG: GTP-binding protein [Oscillospiraceae bacterium]|nr:GTP-binding protein [Oscillospiraceae bacterium]